MQITKKPFNTHQTPPVRGIRPSGVKGSSSVVHTEESSDKVQFSGRYDRQGRYIADPRIPQSLQERQELMENLTAKGGDILLLNEVLEHDHQVKADLDLHRQDFWGKKTPLMRAIQNGFFDHARLLVTYGASPCPRKDSSIVDKDLLGRTVMYYIEQIAPGLDKRERKRFKQDLIEGQNLRDLETPLFFPDGYKTPVEKYRNDLLKWVVASQRDPRAVGPRPVPESYMPEHERPQAEEIESVLSLTSRSGSEDLTDPGSPEPSAETSSTSTAGSSPVRSSGGTSRRRG